MLFPRLIERLLRITVEHAGAERGLLILIRDGEPRIEAEATTGPGRIDVAVREGQATPSDLPQSALHYVIRTQESVLLDDASSDNVYSKDEYVRQNHSKSVLCLPIVRQGKLVGVLYLENNLARCIFTPERVSVLQLLASQAAISLENASLYSDLEFQAGLLQKLPVSAWTLKPDGTPDFVNQVWLEFAGQTLDFVRSHPEAWMTAVHPEDREKAAKSFWEGVRSGEGFAFETRSLSAQDGTYRWHLQRAVVLRDAQGKVLKFVGTTTDIDDQKRAEEKLRESEYEARLTVDSIPGMVVRVSPSGNFEMASRQVLEFLGGTIEELREWGTNETVHPEDLPGVIDAFSQAISAGRAYEISMRLRRWDGVYRWFQERGFPVRDIKGDIARWYLLNTDIDDQKRAEDALRQAQDDLARINRVTTMGELAASLAHEISQPISGAITNANVCLRKLERDQPDLDGARTAVTRFARDAQRAAEIIGRIRSQFKKGALNRDLVDLNEINRETVGLLRDEFGRYNISVRTELATDLPQMVGDRVQLQQVSMNLIVNGIEAMKDKDGIREIIIKSQRDEDEGILVAVSDTGVGFPQQLAEQIFDPFFTTKPQGTGMGLRICRSIIESHGGRLWAVGTPGRGATFHLSLPAAGKIP
jgi:PAS domain S-box-containing protein